MLSYTEHGKFRALTQVATYSFEVRLRFLHARRCVAGRAPRRPAKWTTGLAGEQWAA